MRMLSMRSPTRVDLRLMRRELGCDGGEIALGQRDDGLLEVEHRVPELVGQGEHTVGELPRRGLRQQSRVGVLDAPSGAPGSPRG